MDKRHIGRTKISDGLSDGRRVKSTTKEQMNSRKPIEVGQVNMWKALQGVGIPNPSPRRLEKMQLPRFKKKFNITGNNVMRPEIGEEMMKEAVCSLNRKGLRCN